MYHIVFWISIYIFINVYALDKNILSRHFWVFIYIFINIYHNNNYYVSFSVQYHCFCLKCIISWDSIRGTQLKAVYMISIQPICSDRFQLTARAILVKSICRPGWEACTQATFHSEKSLFIPHFLDFLHPSQVSTILASLSVPHPCCCFLLPGSITSVPAASTLLPAMFPTAHCPLSMFLASMSISLLP